MSAVMVSSVAGMSITSYERGIVNHNIKNNIGFIHLEMINCLIFVLASNQKLSYGLFSHILKIIVLYYKNHMKS